MIIAFFSRSSLYPVLYPSITSFSHRHQTPPNISVTFLFFPPSFPHLNENDIANCGDTMKDHQKSRRPTESRLSVRRSGKKWEYRATWQLSTKGRRNRWEWRSRGFHGTTRRTDTRSGSEHTRIANSCSAMFASEFPPPRGGSIVSQGGTTW